MTSEKLGKSALPGEKADQVGTKMMVQHEILSERRERSFAYLQWVSIEIDIDFLQQ